MRFEIKIDVSNDAFRGPDGGESPAFASMELARILHELAAKMESGSVSLRTPGALFDTNGNHVGRFELIGLKRRRG